MLKREEKEIVCVRAKEEVEKDTPRERREVYLLGERERRKEKGRSDRVDL